MGQVIAGKVKVDCRHLATRKCAPKDLPGIPALLDQATLMDLPKSPVAVLGGTALSPGQPWKHGK